jgi:hypothetical protein
MRKHSMSEKCSNCGYVFTSVRNYCPDCGQKNKQLAAPLKYLLEEVLESTLHFDSKSVRTVVSLLIKPGHLSAEFISGRRARYVPPIRLYVFISFIFFFLLSLLNGRQSAEVSAHQTSQEGRSGISFTIKQINSKELTGLSLEQVDALIEKRGVPKTGVYRFVFHQMHKVANNSAAEFSHLLIKNISYMMFVLMPVFGAWIYAFNRRRRKFFIESLVTSIHFHCFLFLILAILVVLSAVIKNELPLLLMPIIGLIYMYFMFRKVFQQSVVVTLMKMLGICLLYLSSFLFLIMCTALVSLLAV